MFASHITKPPSSFLFLPVKRSYRCRRGQESDVMRGVKQIFSVEFYKTLFAYYDTKSIFHEIRSRFSRKSIPQMPSLRSCEFRRFVSFLSPPFSLASVFFTFTMRLMVLSTRSRLIVRWLSLFAY